MCKRRGYYRGMFTQWVEKNNLVLIIAIGVLVVAAMTIN
jgi:hypothetical protein